jgi:hypothetical protein
MGRGNSREGGEGGGGGAIRQRPLAGSASAPACVRAGGGAGQRRLHAHGTRPPEAGGKGRAVGALGQLQRRARATGTPILCYFGNVYGLFRERGGVGACLSEERREGLFHARALLRRARVRVLRRAPRRQQLRLCRARGTVRRGRGRGRRLRHRASARRGRASSRLTPAWCGRAGLSCCSGSPSARPRQAGGPLRSGGGPAAGHCTHLQLRGAALRGLGARARLRERARARLGGSHDLRRPVGGARACAPRRVRRAPLAQTGQTGQNQSKGGQPQRSPPPGARTSTTRKSRLPSAPASRARGVAPARGARRARQSTRHIVPASPLRRRVRYFSPPDVA